MSNIQLQNIMRCEEMLFSKEPHQDFDMNGVFLHKRETKEA